MKRFNKKIVLFLSAFVLVSTLSLGKAMGYFTTYSKATGGYTMDLGFTDTIIHEDVDKDGKHVEIENIGDYDCYVRIKVFAADYLEIKYDAGKNWEANDDGYYYYNQVLTPKEKTSLLHIHYTLPEITDENKNQEHYIDYNHLSCEEIQELRETDATPKLSALMSRVRELEEENKKLKNTY